MTSILDIFSKSNNEKNNISNFKKTKESFSDNLKTTSLTQGERFIKYQNKITKKYKNTLEGFTPSLSKQTHFVLDVTDPLTSTDAKNAVSKLNLKTKSTLAEYESAETGGNNEINDYYARISPKNPYLNTNIQFSTGEIAYVTNQGVVKLYPNNTTLVATAGINGCPNVSNITKLNIGWSSNYNEEGVSIPTKYPLITGTPMTQGQSCGYEGTNVYVGSMVSPNTSSKYIGCFADNSSAPAMTYIGPAPPQPSPSAQIPNPDFDYPQLSDNSYQYIDSAASTVPGWFFNAYIINNSTSWGFPMPYPNGNQAACILGNNGMGTVLYLDAGTYTLSLYAVGRPGYQTNNIYFTFSSAISSVNLGSSNVQANNISPNQNSWQFYTFPLIVNQSGYWNFSFNGNGLGGGGQYVTSPSGSNYCATAIQHIILESGSSSSNGGGGSYTEETCKQAAMYQGYKYYALQNSNSSGVGYCAVSNDLIQATQYGTSTTVSNQTILWQSNTSGQPGNTANLNQTGSLVILNSSGTNVFTTPNNSSFPSNYLGCYADQSTRAFQSTINNGTVEGAEQSTYSWNYGVDSCQQAAQSNGYLYFGLQDSNVENEAVCFMGNSLSDALQYGPATNCTTFSDNTVNGGGWSNAVYSTNMTGVNYFLYVTDQGLLAICLGQNPNDNQGTIWQIQGAPQQANPQYIAENSPLGQNWIPVGTSLAAGDFVGSPNGYCALIMQQNGNLEFVTFQMAINCATVNGSNVGGVGANAIYELSEVGLLSNMSQVAYIDPDSILHPYESSNVALGNAYLKMPFFDSSGNNLPNTPINVSSTQECENICSGNNECYGFSIINGVCYPKNNQMYPTGEIQQNQDATLYVRNQIPMFPPYGAPAGVNEINSSLYQNYVLSSEYVTNSGEPINGSAPEFDIINPATSPTMQELQGQLDVYGRELDNSINVYNGSDITVNNQSTKNIKGLKNYLEELENTQEKIKNFNLTTSNILDNSDITVLQKNYNYMFWSILAIGTVVVSMNIVKK